METSSPLPPLVSLELEAMEFHDIEREAKEIAEWLVRMDSCGNGVAAIALRHALTNIIQDESIPENQRRGARHIRSKLFYAGM